MSKQRFDLVISSTDRNGVKRFTKCGCVFQDEKGLSIIVDPGVSIHSQEGCYINGYIPKPRDGQGGGSNDDGAPF